MRHVYRERAARLAGCVVGAFIEGEGGGDWYSGRKSVGDMIRWFGAARHRPQPLVLGWTEVGGKILKPPLKPPFSVVL